MIPGFPDLEYTRDIVPFVADLLRLQAVASQPYAAFTYDDNQQAARLNQLLFDAGVADFCAPAPEFLLERGAVVGVFVALDDALLRRRRFAAAKAIMRAGDFDRSPGFANRLQLAGTTLHQATVGDWYLSRIAIAEAARGRGFARLLVNRFLTEGRARGMVRAVLEVDPSNRAALHLYHATGFEPLAEHGVTDPVSGRSLRYRIMALPL